MLTLTISHEKDGQIITSDYNNKPITEENLEYVLMQLISNLDYSLEKVEKDGVTLEDDEIKAITDKYPCMDKFDEFHNYFHSEASRKIEFENKDTVAEWCPYCNYETELLNNFTIQPCKECGEKLLPCAQCVDMDCKNCPFKNEKVSENKKTATVENDNFTELELMNIALSLYHLHNDDSSLAKQYLDKYEETMDGYFEYQDAHTYDEENTKRRQLEIVSKAIGKIVKLIEAKKCLDEEVTTSDTEDFKNDNNLEVVQTFGRYSVIKYYANAIYTNDDKENGTPYYGDIYCSRKDVIKEHPEAVILEGYGIYDNVSKYAPDNSKDWYDTLEEALEHIALHDKLNSLDPERNKDEFPLLNL